MVNRMGSAGAEAMRQDTLKRQGEALARVKQASALETLQLREQELMRTNSNGRYDHQLYVIRKELDKLRKRMR
jgi:hypothetical protein